MDPNLSAWMEILFRWIHVVAGIAWIGHLYFFNFVNSQVAKTYDADSKRKVVPQLMPRALYWFRWGAAWTWISGFLLAGLVYYMSPNLLPPDSAMSMTAGVGLSLVLIVAVFFVYDALWKAMAAKEQAGIVVSAVLVAIVAWGMSRVFAPRAVWIHVGMLFGTVMAMNVWMRIWPAQRKIIAAIGSGAAPETALVSMATLRSKHNTYMSVPLVLLMVSNHYPTVYGRGAGWVILLALVLAGWALTKWLYGKSGGPAPAKY
jgi:uncharacterized membrane protein